MDPKIQFFFYLAAIVCFIVAAIGDTWKYGGRSRKQLAPVLVLVPLGLALFAFPFMWNAATIGW